MGEGKSELPIQYGMKELLRQPKPTQKKPEIKEVIPPRQKLYEFPTETYVMADDGTKGCTENVFRAVQNKERKRSGCLFWFAHTYIDIRSEYSHTRRKSAGTSFATYDRASRRIVSLKELAEEKRNQENENPPKVKIKLI